MSYAGGFEFVVVGSGFGISVYNVLTYRNFFTNISDVGTQYSIKNIGYINKKK